MTRYRLREHIVMSRGGPPGGPPPPWPAWRFFPVLGPAGGRFSKVFGGFPGSSGLFVGQPPFLVRPEALPQQRCLRNKRSSKLYDFFGLGPSKVTEPDKFGDTHGPKPNKIIGFRWAFISQIPVLRASKCHGKEIGFPGRMSAALSLKIGPPACQKPEGRF